MTTKNFILILLIFFSINNLFCEWNLVAPSDIVYKVQSIQCPDSNNCFALIDHPSTPVLYKSTNQGTSWFLIYENEIKRYPALIMGVSPNPKYYFFIEDTYSNLWKSIDSGYTFKEIQLEPGFIEFSNLSMYDPNFGFATNENNFFTTTDGWETFVRHPKKSDQEGFTSPFFLDSNVVLLRYLSSPWPDSLGMALVKYYISTESWDTVTYFWKQVGVGADYIYSLFFVNDKLGFASGRRSDKSLPKEHYYDLIYKTTDGGYNWYVVLNDYIYPEIGFINNIAFADSNNGMAVGFYGKIAMTNDGGETWVYEPTPNAMDNARKMLVCWAGRTPLIGTWDAGIFRYEGDFFKFSVGVEEKPEGNQRFKSLVSINPNPAGEYIELKLSESSKLSESYQIQIYNVYGECLLTIPNTLNPKPKIDVSGLPVGMYFLRFGDEITKFIKY